MLNKKIVRAWSRNGIIDYGGCSEYDVFRRTYPFLVIVTKDSGFLSIIEDSYFHKVLSLVKGSHDLREQFMALGDSLGVKRPEHLRSDQNH